VWDILTAQWSSAREAVDSDQLSISPDSSDYLPLSSSSSSSSLWCWQWTSRTEGARALSSAVQFWMKKGWSQAGHKLRSMLEVSFSALTLMVGWHTGYSAHKTTHSTNPEVLFWNRWRRCREWTGWPGFTWKMAANWQQQQKMLSSMCYKLYH